MSKNSAESVAAIPRSLSHGRFNASANLPYGLTCDHVGAAMRELLEFLRLVNGSLAGRSMPRLEAILMPANFSSIVGEFMTATMPRHCPSIVKNSYHNGHPDILPKGRYPNDSQLHAIDGIEVKGSRYLKGWQGHNPEECFLMVFVFDSNRPSDDVKNVPPKPFSFVKVVGAELETGDWKFSGRSPTSRRTITATVLPSGSAKMEANWIYRDLDLDPNASTFI
ncbi:MAG: hypothetical protein J5I93_14970 [Pirellulaceae bacterium]|nr:hypothetical protein [Pirellulaceae bacterium]